MDPNKIAVLNVVDDGLGEKAVDFLVGSPGGLVKGDLTRVVMEERPKNGVCSLSACDISSLERIQHTREAIVVAVGEIIVYEDRMSTILVLEAVAHAIDFCFWDLETRPAIPLEACSLRESAEAGDEAAR